MGKKHPGIDAYIAKSADFAKPILKRLRKVVHSACLNVEEDLKWNFPHFLYKGMLCSMAAFKAHCSFGFWRGSLLAEKYPELGSQNKENMGQFGRITDVSEVPDDKLLVQYIKAAMKLNDEGIKPKQPAKPKRKAPPKTPDYFLAALKKNKKALATFEDFSPSCKREYIDWITQAKQEETRQRRMDQAITWIAEGKSRNWKYEKC
jgi:uncharacterized protein YdeI (YjbR/CyaY-like superfamily)